MKEQNIYTAARTGAAAAKWESHRVVAYTNQIMFAQRTPAEIGMRNQRELQTFSLAIDALLEGNLGFVGDILMQRYKAIEASMAEGCWDLARHYELIPPMSATTVSASERSFATRMAIREAKLKQNLKDVRAKSAVY